MEFAISVLIISFIALLSGLWRAHRWGQGK